MEKAILILDGNNQAKNQFLQIVKNENLEYSTEPGWWVWSINSNDVAGVAARTLKFNEERNSKYYSFVKELKELGNKHTNFEVEYYKEMVEKFHDNPKPQLLIIHGVEKDLVEHLKETYGAFSILVTKYVVDPESEYDVSLCWNPDLPLDEEFVSAVQTTIQKLTKQLTQ